MAGLAGASKPDYPSESSNVGELTDSKALRSRARS